ncbi:MAG TPA: SIR2 family protein [Polyangia bacterium]|jgi:tetratricopeptide (TPR) repeat protein|nr:SIR2 family protein [Polyangia bacterium]
MAGDIPGNEHVRERLRELLKEGTGIAFVGAGASAGLYPLWGELIERLADEAVKRGLAAPADREFWLRKGNKAIQAVRGIKQALGESIYGKVMREIFRPKRGPDGRQFTPLHAALVELPFRGLVTTNYDPGLTEARLELRPEVRGTGYATWKDGDAVSRWYTGEIFVEEALPILFAHGNWERSDTIVLGVQEYRDAYKAGAYRRLFDKLWGQDRLVFVGFGFNDEWLGFLADEVVTQTAQGAAEPRHIALVGLAEEEDYTPEMRRTFQDQYGAEVYFYPVRRGPDGQQDHSALGRMLEELVAEVGVKKKACSPDLTSAAPARREETRERWVHEITDDEFYVERAGVIDRLERWAVDPEVRLIGVTGLGGQGKTSLVGHWLKARGGAAGRRSGGLFSWSFYANREVSAFLAALLEFAKELGCLPRAKPNARAVEKARQLLREVPLVLVLDGLELLQERPGSVAYGELLEDDLRELLDACGRQMKALVVLTSRFPFADLRPYLGTGLRNLDLACLTDDEGAQLLAKRDVGGSEEARRVVSRRLEGHPLALRVFAAALALEGHDDPTRLYRSVFDEQALRGDDPLEAKLKRLLVFYQEKLPEPQVLLLGIVALFRAPVDVSTVCRLAHGLPIVRERLGGLGNEAIEQALRQLCNSHLLMREAGPAMEEYYGCHPVLRDHFRQVLLRGGPEIAGKAAEMLAGQPSPERTESVRQIEPVLTAIELLLEAGVFVPAHQLYRERLENGLLFQRLPALKEGLRCALGFVGTVERRAQSKHQLAAADYAFSLNEAGLFASLAGEVRSALHFYQGSLEIYRGSGSLPHLPIGLRNQSELCRYLGRLGEAEVASREALSLAEIMGDKRVQEGSWASLGAVLATAGRTPEAVLAFEQARAIAVARHVDGGVLYGLSGVRWAELLLRLGRGSRARRLTEANLGHCKRYRQSNDVARCHGILGRLDTTEGQLASAGEHLATAESTLRQGHMLRELPTVLLAVVEFHVMQGAFDEALQKAEEALRIAAPRELRLHHADALVTRGRVLLIRAQALTGDAAAPQRDIEKAQDDGEAGLALAKECGYAWAERDALRLLSETTKALGDPARSKRLADEVRALERRLLPEDLPPDPPRPQRRAKRRR